MFYLSLSKKVFVVICLLSLFFIDALSTTPDKKIKKEVKFQKVQEKTYDKRIGAIAFAKTIVDGKEKVYLKVIAMGGEVEFLDERGEIISRKSLVVTKPKVVGKFFGKEVIMSSKGSFVSIREYTGEFGDPMNYIVEEEFTICNDKGEEIYRIKVPVKGMGSTDQWLISDKDGTVVGTRIAYGAIDFFGPDGSIKIVPIFGELGWRNAVARAILSGDGEYLAVLAKDVPGPRREVRFHKATLWVMLFDIKGNELWRRKADEQRYGNIAISEHGEYLFFKAFTFGEKKERRNKGEERPLTSVTLSLYDKEGNETGFKDTSLFTYGGFRFSPKADYAALAGDNLIWLMRTKDGSTIFKTELPENRRIRDILFSEDGQYLIVKTETKIGTEKMGGGHIPVYIYPVFVFNIKGDLVWQKEFSDLREISSLDGSLIFSFPQRYEIFEEIE